MLGKLGTRAILGGCTLYCGYYSHHVYSDDGSGFWVIATVIALYLLAAVSVVRWLGGRGAIVLLASLGAAALAIESVGVLTGFPYGAFSYGDGLGAKVFGIVPWTVALVWPVLLLGAMALGARWGGAKASMTAAVPAFVAFDLVIDPGAVALGLWSWEGSGPYYGVPVGNLAGWAVTGISGILIVALALGRQRDRLESVPVEVALSALLHVLFFSAVCFAHDRFFPGLLGLAIVAGSGIASFTVSAAQPAALVQPGGQRCEQDERR